MEKMLVLDPNGPKVALVLGAAVWPDARASPTLLRRSSHAVALFEAGAVDVILACGGVGENPPSEAEVITQLCLAGGVPQTALRQETNSTTTRENLTFATPILQSLNPSAVVIVTDPYHGPRAALIARQIGLPATLSTPRAAEIGPRQWIKHSIREAVGLMATAFRLR